MLKKIFLLTSLILLLSACGGGNSGSTSSSTDSVVPDEGTSGVGILKPSVILIESDRDDLVAFSTENTWNLREIHDDIKIGSVLLLDDDAIKVTAVREENAATVIDILPAEIEDVFSKLDLSQSIDFSNATVEGEDSFDEQITSEWITVPAESERSVNGISSIKQSRPVSAGAYRSRRIKINQSPFSGSVDFVLAAEMNYKYDEDGEGKTEGFLNVTGTAFPNINIVLQGSASVSIPEYQLPKEIKIPIPFTVDDHLLRKLGVRVASINVPISFGAEASIGYDVGLKIFGYAQSNLEVSYDDVNKFSSDGPNNSGALEFTSELPAIGPLASAKINVRAGPYVRARPQLRIINKVATMGADVKVGLYGNGDLSAFPQDPYYCLKIQPKLEGSVYGFFKAVGFGVQETAVLPLGSLNVGEPLTEGQCDAASVELQSGSCTIEYISFLEESVQRVILNGIASGPVGAFVTASPELSSGMFISEGILIYTPLGVPSCGEWSNVTLGLGEYYCKRNEGDPVNTSWSIRKDTANSPSIYNDEVFASVHSGFGVDPLFERASDREAFVPCPGQITYPPNP